MTLQNIDYLDIRGVKIPLKEFPKMKVFEEDLPVVLTDSGIYYWNWLSPEHTRNVPYKEITGIYQKIREDKDSNTSHLFDNLGIIDDSSIYWLPPNETLKNSIIENVLEAKKSVYGNAGQSDTNSTALEIKGAMNKGYYKTGEYYPPRNIRSKIKGITGNKVHNLGKGCIILGYRYPFFATENWLALMGTGKNDREEIGVIPRNKAFYSLRKVVSSGHGPKSETLLDIYNICTSNTECPTPEITYQYFNREEAIKLMKGKI